MKKILEDDESSVEVSVHQQPLVTKSCYHQDRELNKRQNTAAKLRPKTEARILQLTAEVVLTSRLIVMNGLSAPNIFINRIPFQAKKLNWCLKVIY